MKNIIYFNWFNGGTEWYRLLPLDYITSPDFTITRCTDRDVNFLTLSKFDVAIIERPSSEAALNIIKLAKDLHLKVILDWDDDCLHLPMENPMYDTYESEKSNTIECLALADEIWVATEGIKKSFRLYNRNIHVIPNAWNDYVFKVADKRPFVYNQIAMWRGGHSHIGDIYAPGVTEELLDLINSNQDWKFYMLGQRFEWLEQRVIAGNYYRHHGADTVQFYKLMQKYNPCLFFYPLADNLFNRSKSNCSWLESTYAGAAFFGNKGLPDFDNESIADLSELRQAMYWDEEELKVFNTLAWGEICDTLLLSKVNEIRKERLLSI